MTAIPPERMALTDADITRPGPLKTALADKADASHTHNGMVVPSVGATAPPGSSFPIVRSANAHFGFGAVAGTEYAVGVYLGPCPIEGLGVQVSTGQPSLFKLALRPIDENGVIGAPVVEADFDTTNSGTIWSNFEPVLLHGAYALSWTSIRSGSPATLQRSSIDQNSHLFSLNFVSRGLGFPATGHGPTHIILNNGVTGQLPATVNQSPVGTNFASETSFVPQLVARRAAS